MKPKFCDSLRVKNLDGPYWELIHRMRYWSSVLGREIVVPNGFVTDFESVRGLPPFGYWLLSTPNDRPAVVHDYLYRTAEDPRKKCDETFYEAMDVENYPGYRRYIMYYGVRAAGWYFYGRRNGTLDPR